MLLTSYLKSAWNIDIADQITNRSSRLSLWSMLLVTSLVSISSSASIYDKNCLSGGDTEDKFCNRTVLSIVIGCVGTVSSLLVVASKFANSDAPFIMESFVGALLFVLQAFGVAYTTSDNGPGAPLGNLYYSSWFSFVCSFFIGSSCFEEHQAHILMKEQEKEEHRFRKRFQQRSDKRRRANESGMARFTYEED
uniref:Uncharacterized protein n=2 Tax=Ditylum brightwellii TaxID=49249 RepID=A0A7S4QLC8_9STRA|mmetsp:Transcript_7231/g.10703  ORF Transcript_7231/g.10703 Transcript_7231/m.10703 type:complete len:194 (+) Transcript_7231:380-961(+)